MRRTPMKMQSLVLCAALGLVAGTVGAQDMKKDSMSKGAMKPMTMKECNDYMAMAAKDAMKKEADKDKMCAEMKKDGGMMKSDSTMKKEAAPKK